jgi:hypothetical protein
MRSRNILAPALSAILLCSGCATHPKSFRLLEVAPGVFWGHKPWLQAHFEEMRAQGVRSILSLEQLPWDIWPERRQARRNGLEYRNVPIMASPLEPPEKRVKQALLVLNDASLRPIFVHCLLGEDRAAFLVGLYRMYFQDWTPQAAFDEMLRLGFHVRPTLRGFDTYFWNHTQKPDWVKALRAGQEKKPP